MSAVIRKMKGYGKDVVAAVRLAPVEVVAGVTVAAVFSYTVEAGGDDAFRTWAETAVVCGLVAGTAWIATLFRGLGQWSGGARWGVTAAGALAAGAYGLFGLRLERIGDAWRAGLLLSFVGFAIFCVPVLASAAGPGALRRFRRLNLRLSVRSAGVALYGAALYLGLALAVGSVDVLFELDLDGATYAHVFGWIAFALVPWVIVGGVPALTRPVGEEPEVSPALRRFTVYLLTPLIVVYYAILYAYAVRIAFTGELPANLVSPLVLAAGGLAALVAVVFDSEESRGADASRPSSGSEAAHPPGAFGSSGSWSPARVTLPLFLPLAGLGLWAVAVRVGQYGWTEFRYVRFGLLAVLTVLALGGAVQVLGRRRLDTHLVPAILAAWLLAASIGPWSAPGVSFRSQQVRLEGALRDAGILQPGESMLTLAAVAAAEGREVPNEIYEAIASTSRYLRRHFGAGAVERMLPEEMRGEGSGESGPGASPDLAIVLGLNRAEPLDVARFEFARVEDGVPIPGMPAGTLYRIEVAGRGEGSGTAPPPPPPRPPERPTVPPADSIPSAANPVSVRLDPDIPDSARLRIRVEGEALEVDLAPLVSWLAEDDAPVPGAGGRVDGTRALPASRAVLDVVSVSPDGVRPVRGRLLVEAIRLQWSGGRNRVTTVQGLLVVEDLGAEAAEAEASDVAAVDSAPVHGASRARRGCTVRRIIDGDTFVCSDGERVRLTLIDTPEMGDGALGGLARARLLERMPPATEVELELDVSERDRYGRLLAYVRLADGRMVNRALAREGFAQTMVVPPNVRYVDEIRAAVDSARMEGAGLWGSAWAAAEPTAGAGGVAAEPEVGTRGVAPGENGTARAGGECLASYPEVCIPPAPPDLDCGDVPFRRFDVEGPDPHRFDGDGDGIGCEGESD